MAFLASDSLKPSKPSHPFSFYLKTFACRNLESRNLVKVRADVGFEFRISLSSDQSGNPASILSSTSSYDDKIREILRNRDYKEKFRFNVDVDSSIPKGLSKEIIRLISLLKEEPDWMLEFRLTAFERFLSLKEPKWSDNQYPTVDFQDICYCSTPKKKSALNNLDEAGPELLQYFDRLGVPLNECYKLADVDAVLDSVSIAATHLS